MSDSVLPAWCRIVRDVTPGFLAEMASRPVTRSPADAVAVVWPRVSQEEVEVVVAIFLNTQGHVIALQEVTRGLVNSSLVHPREVYRLAIAMNASSVIVAHNHPSGELTPSPEDRAVTKQLVEAGDILGIPLLDHLILGSYPDKYFSFSESGLL